MTIEYICCRVCLCNLNIESPKVLWGGNSRLSTMPQERERNIWRNIYCVLYVCRAKMHEIIKKYKNRHKSRAAANIQYFFPPPLPSNFSPSKRGIFWRNPTFPLPNIKEWFCAWKIPPRHFNKSAATIWRIFFPECGTISVLKVCEIACVLSTSKTETVSGSFFL